MKRFILISLTATLMFGCKGNSPDKPHERPTISPPPAVPEADLRTTAEGDAAFAVDLQRRLRVTNGNLIYSPASISMALAMTYAGAAGETADEMKKVMHFTLPAEKLHAVNHKRLYDWNGADGAERPYELSVANSLWGQKDESWKKEFLDLLNTHYGSGFHQVDFVNAAEAARNDVNKWVADWTHDKIPEVVPPGVFTSDTRLALANAVYFKGTWAHPFDETWTKEADFFLGDGTKAKASMMYQSRHFNYAEHVGVQRRSKSPCRGFDSKVRSCSPTSWRRWV
jgi:serpin B